MITTIIPTLDEVLPFTPDYFEDISLRNNALVATVFPSVNTMVEEMNATATQVNDDAVQVAADRIVVSSAKDVAVASAIEASNLLDQFDDRYLGAKVVAPTVDNDGNALMSGTLYWNSTLNVMFVFDLGLATWVDISFTPTNHNTLSNIGTKTHAQLEAEKADLATSAQKDELTGAVYIGDGTTLERPTLPPTSKAMWYNTDLSKFEGWNGTQWVGIGGGATGGGADTVFVETSYTVTQDYTITAGKSAITVGDANGNVTIPDGVTISIPDGSVWVIQGV